MSEKITYAIESASDEEQLAYVKGFIADSGVVWDEEIMHRKGLSTSIKLYLGGTLSPEGSATLVATAECQADLDTGRLNVAMNIK